MLATLFNNVQQDFTDIINVSIKNDNLSVF